jgi:hypothetical protein
MRRNNPGLMIGGIVLTFAGAVGLVFSAVLITSANGRYEIYCDDGGGFVYRCDERDDEAMLTGGWVTLGGSLAAMAVGIPLWVIGGKRVPATDQKEESEQPKAALRPTLVVGPGSASLKMAF